MILAVNSCTVVDEPALTCLPPCAGSPTSCPTTTAGSSSSPRTTRRGRTLSTPTLFQASTPSGSSSSLRYVIVNSQREFIVTQAYYLQLPTGVNRYAIVNHTTPSGSFAKIKKLPLGCWWGEGVIFVWMMHSVTPSGSTLLLSPYSSRAQSLVRTEELV